MRKPDWLYDAEPFIPMIIYGLLLFALAAVLYYGGIK